MKKTTSLVTLLLIIFAIYWSFKSLMPTYQSDASIEKTAFSTDKALAHVKQLSQKPHAVGFEGHEEVRQYIVSELKKMGLKATLQEGYTTGRNWGNFSKAINILARIKGSGSGKSLLLLSHYDSNPHSSLGASDAGSGVATILEGIRAFIANNQTPKNDVIVLFSDAEELGLNGADLFVNNHPWAKEIGLVLNFEARGSGGPGYVFMETNRGNQNLVQEFIKANPEYPLATSLYYSIYQLLPNFTDLTVFRQDGDIEGMNFAFIDDHFDYHTEKDSYERLDKNTLTHQGSYLMPLLNHFSNTNLNTLKSLNDYVYFNIPFFGMVSYPFEWIWLMFGLAIICLVLILISGFRKNVLNVNAIGKGFLPLLIVLAINSLVGFFSWSVLKWMYPQYKDMLHGFTYNGYTYIFAFVLLSVSICFWVYHKFKKVETPNLLVAPIVLWLAICCGLAIYLQGASFFIIPVFAVLATLFVTISQEKPSAYLMVFLTLPAIWLYAPLVQGLAVGLGLKMMIGSTLLTTLTFVLVLPVFGFYQKKKRFAYIGFVLFLGCMISAHLNSGFSKDNAKPNSLLYVLDANTNTAQWGTYENVLSDWTAQYLDDNKKAPEKLAKNIISSKYSTGFTYVSEAPMKPIPEMKIEKTRDTIIGNSRLFEICITPQRNVNRLDVFTNDITIESAKVNTVELSDYYLENRIRGKLITHYISNNEYTDLQLIIPKDSVLELTLYEASNDLLSNSHFTIPQRPEDNIPMPFVLNDAILVTKTVRFE